MGLPGSAWVCLGLPGSAWVCLGLPGSAVRRGSSYPAARVSILLVEA